MKKIITSSLLLALGFVSALAQTHTLTLTSNDETLGTVSYKVEDGGALPGEFSVSATKKVRFSKGNLQYQASTKTWRFAEHQYDYIGNNNKNISSTYTGWIDLFGWGTSGYDNTANDSYAKNFQPWASSKAEVNSTNNYYGYGPSLTMTDKNLTGTSANYDWGVYNAITNGGNAKGMWRTLTKDEWVYLLSTRSTPLRSLATVNGKKGLIILPDNWVKPSGISYTATTSDYTTNTYTAAQWTTMEDAGAVFLPAAGSRNGTSMGDVGTYGYYWSSSYYSSNKAYGVLFRSGGLYPSHSNYYRSSGHSVRLCADIE